MIHKQLILCHFFQLSFEGKKANLIMKTDGNTYVLDQLV